MGGMIESRDLAKKAHVCRFCNSFFIKIRITKIVAARARNSLILVFLLVILFILLVHSIDVSRSVYH